MFFSFLRVTIKDATDKKKSFGSQGLVVPCLGLGCMGMTAFYGDFNRHDAEETNQKTIDLAVCISVLS